MTARTRTARDMGIIAAALMVVAAGLAVLPACSRRPAATGLALIPVSVRVELPGGSAPAAVRPGGGPAVEFVQYDSISVSALERVSDRYVLRAAAGARVGQADTAFRISLEVPYASRYTIAVEAIGYQCGRRLNSEDCTLQGVQLYGEAPLDLAIAAPEPLDIRLADVVPLASGTPVNDNTGLLIQWPANPLADTYTLTESESPPLTVRGTSVSLPNASYRIRANLYNGLSSAYSEFIPNVGFVPPASVAGDPGRAKPAGSGALDHLTPLEVQDQHRRARPASDLVAQPRVDAGLRVHDVERVPAGAELDRARR